ncbi:MAG: hypothetical protein JW966_02915 [Anaerolineae bacterium]|nr:hypothetical protein [Anaerolineae bacterium]
MNTPPPGRLVRTDTFESADVCACWKPMAIGTGRLNQADGVLRCVLDPSDTCRYNDAQITDYQGLPRRAFPWRPPLRLTVRAWASHTTERLRGTAGFGFWNEPFVPVQRGLPRLPRAVWFFFGSPPNNMALACGVPGYGWKAATIDASRLRFWLMAPVAPLGFALMRVPVVYRRLWPVGQWALGVSEAQLSVDLSEPHTYELDWLPDSVCFRVDGQPVHVAPTAPRGPLGFIAWIDNQYAVVTPQGHFKFGVLTTDEPQWFALDRVTIHSL